MNKKFSDRAQKAESSIIRRMLELSINPEYISFAGGDPDPQLFPPLPSFNISRKDLQYGMSQGDEALRQAIVEYMKRFDINTVSDNILITTGSQQGLDLTGKLFIDEGDVVIVERPTYLGAANAFRQYGAQFIDIDNDEDGMNIKQLEEALIVHPKAKFIYTIPDFQNPSGSVMSLEKRKELLNLAKRYDVHIIEDSPYYELRYDGENIPTLKSLDQNDSVIYLGSFSKTVCPGLRVGWIATSEEVISGYLPFKQSADMHTNAISQLQLTNFLKSEDLEKHLQSIRKAYSEKRDVAVQYIDREFPKNINYYYPHGGLFLWLELPEGWDGEDLMEECLKDKVSIIPGSSFFVKDPKKNTIRLSFATMDKAHIEEGLRRMNKAFRKYAGAGLTI